MGVSHSKENNIYLITYNCQIKYYSTFKSNRLLNYILNFKNNKFIFCLQCLYDTTTIKYLEDNVNTDLTKIKSSHDNGLYIISNFDITSVQEYLFKHDIRKKLPFKKNSFDLIISLGCLHNLNINNLISALGEINRVAKKSYIMVESYRNELELFNLQCWALTCNSFFNKNEWKWLFKNYNRKGDYEFIYFS